MNKAPDTVEFYEDSAGEHRWKIVAPNGREVDASSEGFSSAYGAKRNLVRCGHGDLIPEWPEAEHPDE